MANDQDVGRADSPPGLDIAALKTRLTAALAEDVGPGDITSLALIPEDAAATARLVARQAGLICGLCLVQPILDLAAEKASRPRVTETFAPGFPTPSFEQVIADGDRAEAGDILGRVSGSLRAILAAERTMLNFLQHLSGIATLTAAYAAACAGTGAVLLDTRKTTPGWRDLEKYAVRKGGGRNHRMGLYDAVLIKDNHIDGARLSAAEAVRRAREYVAQAPPPVNIPAGGGWATPGSPAGGGWATLVEIEVRSLDDLRACLAAGPDIVMADNFTVAMLREAVAMVRAHRGDGIMPLLEASGGITLQNVREVALAGVDRIAVGALTHSAPAIDIALEVVT